MLDLESSRVKVCVVFGCGLSERDCEERDRFWNDMDRILDRVGNGCRLCILGDRMRASIAGTFGVPGENDNGRKVMEFYAERGLCIGNTYFKHRSLDKYTRVSRGQDRVEVRSMIDLVLVKKDMLQDVRVVRGMG